MATGLSVIEAAMRMLGMLRHGQTSSIAEQRLGLEALNALIANLSAEELPVYQLTVESMPLTGASSYTWGSGATWDSVRPTRIRSASTKNNGVASPTLIIDSKRWDAIVDKTLTGLYAEVLWPDGGYPLLTVHLHPIPASGGTLEVASYKPLTSIATTGTTIAMPPEYERALKMLLAVDMAPEFNVNLQTRPELIANAQGAKAAIMGVNARVIGPDAMQPPMGGNV